MMYLYKHWHAYKLIFDYLHFSISMKLYTAYPCILLVLLQVRVSIGQLGCEKRLSYFI